MPYRSSARTRQKKDAKRTGMMQAALLVFSEKGYNAATIRDIVQNAGVAIGTFYFYFPDKETLFLHLYEETGEFLLRTIRQAINGRSGLASQVGAGLQAYINIATYEPAIIQLILIGGMGAAPSLAAKHSQFREKLVLAWKQPFDLALEAGTIPQQNTRRLAELLTGGFDEAVLNLLQLPDPDSDVNAAVRELTQFALRATAYQPPADA